MTFYARFPQRLARIKHELEKAADEICGLPPFRKERERMGHPADFMYGLKPVVFYQPLTARLKSCPDAMRPLETLSTSFSAACKALLILQHLCTG
jgi:hypothetical protein